MTPRWLKPSLVMIALILTVLLLGRTVSYAQGPVVVNGPCGFGGPEDSFVAVAAKTLGIPQTELVSVLRSGKTIADIAKEKGIALEKIVLAVLTERQQMLKTAVAAKYLTQNEADAILAVMKTHIAEHLAQPFGFQGVDMDQMMDQMRGRRGDWIK